MEKIEDCKRYIIEEGDYKAPNPWLDRIGWRVYLRKLDRVELMASVVTLEIEEKPVARVIWDGMVEMIA